MTKSPIIIALDFPNLDEVQSFLGKFKGESHFVKVGMELFYAEGPKVVTYLKEAGHSVFLDLKLHDIPITVYSAMKRLASLGVDLINVHAYGGTAMMRGAMEGLIEGTPSGKSRPLCIAVTQLTSTSEEQLHSEGFTDLALADMVEKQALLVKEAGLDGVVCSPLESKRLKELIGSDFVTVTPGIRPAGADIGDQKRIATPADAKRNLSSYIVVGRPITRAENPVLAYEQIQKEWEETIL